jgi:two-component sensor histidine kinase
LSVSDNGVGMPKDSDAIKPGLGTSIVEALANRLDAAIRIDSANPGTRISIVHSAALASNANTQPAEQAV